MKHFRQIQSEFLKFAYPIPDESMINRFRKWLDRSSLSIRERNWWESLSRQKQIKHLQRHPSSRFRYAEVKQTDSNI